MPIISKRLVAAALLAASVLAPEFAAGQTGSTLKVVKERGTLQCGVSLGLYGFSNPDAAGKWAGFDVDFCRAVAAAIFNDPAKVEFKPFNARDRFSALQSGQIDILARNSTWTMGREVDLGLMFAAVNYFDGQGFIIRKTVKATSVLDLDGSKVCVQSGTTNEQNVADYFKTNNLKFELVSLAAPDEVVKSYDSGRCDVFSTDVSGLYAERLKLTNPDDHVILPDIISKEPLGPVVRQGDDQWLNIVKWVHFAMLNAEELGVSSKTIDQALASAKPDVRRLVGAEGGYGERLGLTNDWAVRAIRAVGNYAEVFERNVGVNSKLGIPRGLNQLWMLGGIQYAPPIR